MRACKLTALVAVQRFVRPQNLEICIVSTADDLLPLLEKDNLLARDQIDVVPYDSY